MEVIEIDSFLTLLVVRNEPFLNGLVSISLVSLKELVTWVLYSVSQNSLEFINWNYFPYPITKTSITSPILV